MSVIASNGYIEVDGLSLYAGYETLFDIKQTDPTCKYVEVTYNLGVGTVRYNFDASGHIPLPMGDYARIMVEAGLTGSQTVLTIDSPLFGSSLSVTATVLSGIQAAQKGSCFPPRRPIPLAGTGVKWAAPVNDLGVSGQSYELVPYGGGAGTTVTTDDHGEIQGRFDQVWQIKRGGDVVWQFSPREDFCGDAAYVEWVSDSGKGKAWVFELVSVERSVTESMTTEGVGAFRGMFFPTKKNWKYTVKVAVRGLAVDETWYFDDFVTGGMVGMTIPYTLLSYAGVLAGSPVQGNVTEKKITRSLTEPTTDLTFTIDCFTVRNF